MRHRKRGRVLGRSPSHRKAMLRNLASALFLTERETDDDLDPNVPKVKGRIVTTLHKAKEVRPLVEKCVTIARHSLQHEDAALEHATDAERGTEQWKQWRHGDGWKAWNAAMAPAIAARRRVIQLIGDKEAAKVLFDLIAPRFEDRDGGYTRILRLAKPRLGDGGKQAVLEFVGVHDRVKEESEKPAFEGGAEDEVASDESADEVAEEETSEEPSAEEETPATEAVAEESNEESADEEKKPESKDE